MTKDEKAMLVEVKALVNKKRMTASDRRLLSFLLNALFPQLDLFR